MMTILVKKFRTWKPSKLDKNRNGLDFENEAKSMQHDECCFGINHWCCVDDHWMYMVEIFFEESDTTSNFGE